MYVVETSRAYRGYSFGTRRPTRNPLRVSVPFSRVLLGMGVLLGTQPRNKLSVGTTAVGTAHGVQPMRGVSGQLPADWLALLGLSR